MAEADTDQCDRRRALKSRHHAPQRGSDCFRVSVPRSAAFGRESSCLSDTIMSVA